MDEAKDRLLSEKTAIIIIITGLCIIVIFTILYLAKGSWTFSLADNINEAVLGQYGDFIGGMVGSIFSLVGIILFYVALRDQRKDFANNQKTLQLQIGAFEQQVTEFEAQRQELVETRKIYEQQNKTMKNQQFDSNFYSLLNLFIQQRSNLPDSFFASITEKIGQSIDEHETNFINRFKLSCNKYINIYIANRGKLSLYFMSLYRLFKTIEDSENLTPAEKISYHKIVRALITKEELLVLYYNYQSSFGKKPLPIVLKYNYDTIPKTV